MSFSLRRKVKPVLIVPRAQRIEIVDLARTSLYLTRLSQAERNSVILLTLNRVIWYLLGEDLEPMGSERLANPEIDALCEGLRLLGQEPTPLIVQRVNELRASRGLPMLSPATLGLKN